MSTVSRRSYYGGLRAHIVNQGAVWHPDIWNTKIIIIIIIIIISNNNNNIYDNLYGAVMPPYRYKVPHKQLTRVSLS